MSGRRARSSLPVACFLEGADGGVEGDDLGNVKQRVYMGMLQGESSDTALRALRSCFKLL